MPLKLYPPKEGRSPFYTIRGRHLGHRVFRSAKTADRRLAKQVLQKLERDIERGALSDAPAVTFSAAALSYLRAGGESRFIKPLSKHFKGVALDLVDQSAIDEAANTLYPGATAGTRNRQVYTPVSAILKHAGIVMPLRRPKGHAGTPRLRWLQPDEAQRLFAACADPEFRALLVLLTYTGCRLGEALKLERRDVDIAAGTAFIGKTKNGAPRSMHLPPVAVAALANLDLAGEGTVFRYRKNGHLYNKLKAAKKAAALSWMTFHTLRHTYATWMRKYARMDTRGLVGTGAWKSEKSAARYAHVVVSEESRQADLMPGSGAEMVRRRKR
jgi:integrase